MIKKAVVIFCILALLTLLGVSTSAVSATIYLHKGQPDKYLKATGSIPADWIPKIYITGDITPGDNKKFAAVLDEMESARRAAHKLTLDVWLNSNGGDVVTAIEIARQIRAKMLETIVDDGATCASSCVLILAGGVRRMAGREARIGLHRPYFQDYQRAGSQGYDKYKVGYEAAIAAHRKFFDEMGISMRLLEAMLEIPSNEIRWISRDFAKSTNLLGSDPSWEEWSRAKAIAEKGIESVEELDRFLKCINSGEGCEGF
jgi:hypothetical protein